MTPDISAIARKFSREAWKFPLLKSRVVTAMTSAIEEATAPWKKAIEGLTPSGSEFVNDPKRCGEYIRQRISDTHDRCVEAVKAKHTAEAATASLRAQLEQRWIPVTAKMPDIHGEYWCRIVGKDPFYSDIPGYGGTLITPTLTPYARTVKTFTMRDGSLAFNCGGTEKVSHWIPLPTAEAVAQESPLNGKHDENCECATCVSLDAAGVE